MESVLGSPIEGRGHPKADWFSEKQGSQWENFFQRRCRKNKYRYGGSVMAGDEFFIPFIAFYEGRTYGQPEVVPISLPQSGNRSSLTLAGSFHRRGFQPDLLMPQRHSSPERRIPCRRYAQGTLTQRAFRQCCFSKTESNVAGNLYQIRQKGGIQTWRFSLHNQNSRTK